MARGATLSQLISDLRDELRRANSPSAGPDDEPSLRRTINHVYRTLYYAHDWSFLKHMFQAITLNAGQRYYDLPDGLDMERIIEARVKWGSQFHPISRGIGFDEYNTYDPEDDERSSPASRWDIRYTGTTDQIEIWPLPDGSSQSLRLFGVYECNELVDEADVCRLESEIVVLYAAAELAKAQDNKDADAKLELAKEMLRLVKIRSASGGETGVQVGLGSAGKADNFRATVRVS